MAAFHWDKNEFKRETELCCVKIIITIKGGQTPSSVGRLLLIQPRNGRFQHDRQKQRNAMAVFHWDKNEFRRETEFCCVKIIITIKGGADLFFA
jgi:hypothetical protein